MVGLCSPMKSPCIDFSNPTNHHNDRPERNKHQLYTRHIPKSKKMKAFLIYKCTEIYNTLEKEYLELDIKHFKTDVMILVNDHFNVDRIPRDSNESESEQDTE